MKTEKEHADELIEQYSEILGKSDTIEYEIKCAINDVTNTIEAMSQMKLIFSDREIVLKYYQTVLQILKDKL